MALPTQNIEILFEGLAQKADAKSTPQAKLVRADNVVVDKMAKLQKRRGYRQIDTSANDVNNRAQETLFTRVAVLSDELVLMADHTWGIVSPTAAVDSTSAVRRGPVLRGSYRLRVVVSGPGQATPT